MPDTQNFRRIGRVGTGTRWLDAAQELAAMSQRLTFASRQMAEEAAEIMYECTIEEITSPEESTYGTGRLKATFGRWEPSYITSSEDPVTGEAIDASAIEQRAVTWAENNGCSDEQTDTYENQTTIENGAYWSVRKFKNGQWTAEVGTFTPYAGKVNDGGEYMAPTFGGGEHPAHYRAMNYLEKGLAEAAVRLADVCQEVIKGTL